MVGVVKSIGSGLEPVDWGLTSVSGNSVGGVLESMGCVVEPVNAVLELAVFVA